MPGTRATLSKPMLWRLTHDQMRFLHRYANQHTGGNVNAALRAALDYAQHAANTGIDQREQREAGMR